MNQEAIKDLCYKVADDLLVLGHRNSEWTGLGPLLEEDIAFSSMAQDKLGQSQQFYIILNELGESDPDTNAFMRNADQFHNSKLVELPIGDYGFSLIRHFLFDNADYLRFQSLSNSSYEPISQLAKKFKGEIKYHLLHANSLIKQLGNATDESIKRLQNGLELALPFALGIFEKSKYEDELIADGIFNGEEELRKSWEAEITQVLSETQLITPALDSLEPEFGGRYGEHTEHLQPLLSEMSEVFNTDPTAEW